MKEALEISAILIAALYAVLLAIVYVGFSMRRAVKCVPSGQQKIAVVIAVRNEESTVVDLLRALDRQSFAIHFQVIVVNDSSSDNTVSQVHAYEPKAYKLTLLNSAGSGKKAALETGINAAEAEIILVTDGDSIPQADWISSYSHHFTDPSVFFVAGLVNACDGNSVLRQTLTTELIFLQVASAGLFELRKPAMCNGANMGFTKRFFVESGGFSKDEYASGDDIALLQKAVARDINGIRWNYAHGSVVTTRMASTWAEAVRQRQRWLSKIRSYSGIGLLFTAPLFLLVQLLLAGALVACWVYGSVANPFVVAFGIKIGVELLLLSLAAPFFGEKKTIPLFPVSLFVYCFISLAAVLRLASGNVQWKGRTWRNGRVR